MNELVLRIEAFFDILATRSVLTELGLVLLTLLAGEMLGMALRERARRNNRPAPMSLSWDYFASQGTLVVLPFVMELVLLVVARSALEASHFDVALMDGAIRLVGAYIIVRTGVLLFAASLGAKSWISVWEGRVALAIWLAIAAEYLGWLDPIIATLDSWGIAAGRSRITVWSVLKLLFILTGFMMVAAWISRWVERRLKRLSAVAPSTRIGIAKFANAFLIALSILMGLNAAGVDLTALTVLTGAVGLGLGFGLQSIAANPTKVGPLGAKALRLRPAATPNLAHKPVSCQPRYTMMNLHEAWEAETIQSAAPDRSKPNGRFAQSVLCCRNEELMQQRSTAIQQLLIPRFPLVAVPK